MPQVKEVSKKGLQREFAITVPQDIVEKNLQARLTEMGQTARLPGFRPGKIPMDVLRKRFGPNARAEVLDRTVSEATEKALTERNLRPAMQPKIELVSFAEDKDLEFKLAVEVLPEVTPGDFSKIAVEKLVAEITDKMIEEAITRAAKAMREPEVVAEGRPAKKGDVLVIDFDGSVDGEKQPGMKGQGHRLELGSKSFIDNFEDQLVGSKPGDTKTIKVKFPAEYHATHLAGKQAEFEVEVKELRAHKPADMSDELAKDLGFPSIDKLRERVRDDISADYGRISRAIVKRQLLDKLAATHDFEIPPGMLEREFDAIWKQVENSKAKGELPEEDKKKSDDALRKEYHGIAERRIRLGLLLAEVAQKQSITVSSTELRNALMAEARRFPGQEKAVVDYYTQTPGELERLRAPLLEEKVIDYILTQAKVSEKTIPAEELLKKTEEKDG
ncbi:MAG: trigger factor [Alphaproteobacteria bacterium]|nr:trigger factor [Alphaproteobacteria bacterium]